MRPTSPQQASPPRSEVAEQEGGPLCRQMLWRMKNHCLSALLRAKFCLLGPPSNPPLRTVGHAWKALQLWRVAELFCSSWITTRFIGQERHSTALVCSTFEQVVLHKVMLQIELPFRCNITTCNAGRHSVSPLLCNTSASSQGRKARSAPASVAAYIPRCTPMATFPYFFTSCCNLDMDLWHQNNVWAGPVHQNVSRSPPFLQAGLLVPNSTLLQTIPRAKLVWISECEETYGEISMARAGIVQAFAGNLQANRGLDVRGRYGAVACSVEYQRFKRVEEEQLFKMPYRALALKDKIVLITGSMGIVAF